MKLQYSFEEVVQPKVFVMRSLDISGCIASTIKILGIQNLKRIISQVLGVNIVAMFTLLML